MHYCCTSDRNYSPGIMFRVNKTRIKDDKGLLGYLEIENIRKCGCAAARSQPSAANMRLRMRSGLHLRLRSRALFNIA